MSNPSTITTITARYKPTMKYLLTTLLLATTAIGQCDVVYLTRVNSPAVDTDTLGYVQLNNPWKFQSTGFDSYTVPGDTAGLDVSPDGKFYIFTTLGDLYEAIRVFVNIPTPFPAVQLNKIGEPGPIAMPGTAYGISYDADRNNLRVVTDMEANIEVDLTSGTLHANTPINSNANIVGIAHITTPDGTTLYGIDSSANTLVRIGGPNGSPSPDDGEVTTIGPVGGEDFDEHSHLDATTDTLYALLRVGGVNRLYTLDPSTGSILDYRGIVGGNEPGAIFSGMCVAADSAFGYVHEVEPPPPPPVLQSPTISLKLNFKKPGTDTIKLSGLLTGFNPSNPVVTVDVGGVSRSFTVDSKGNAKVGSDSLKIKYKPIKQPGPTSEYSKFTLSLKGNFASTLANTSSLENKDTKNEHNIIQARVLDNEADIPVLYTAKTGKSGKAK